ncbi:bacteriophage Gp15 family protein [Butyricicoccus faecihominis]|uniref:bacteriophage Gp15 family protein n=1 Tax=Butyricicoccus faecihominis TaxID=1712515 RepID=UPI00247A01F7|nr:bacteriophage Gp15 family protein [Butyricicoccus faecihominis]
MNALSDRFPDAIEIDGREYEINSDFRDCLTIILAFEDNELTDEEKQAVMLTRLYKTIPPNLTEACEMAVLFLNCGDTRQRDTEPHARLYSFAHDADYIWSAYYQSYGVDLESINHLHWWKFCYMFTDLSEESFFQRMIYLRRRKRDGKLSNEERQAYSQLHDILELPMQKDTEWQEIESEFMRKLGQRKPN